MWWWATARKLGSCSSALLQRRRPSCDSTDRKHLQMCLTNNRISPGKNVLSNNLHNNPFLHGFSSSPGWLLVTRTREAWWCYRGHCRSGPRHLSPRSRVCAQKWHSEDVHSHIHSHPAMHTPKINRAKPSTRQTWRLHSLVPFLSSVVVGDGQEAWQMLRRPQTFTNTSIPIHPCTLLKQRAKSSTHQT